MPRVVTDVQVELDHEYAAFEAYVRNRDISEQMFTTDVDEAALWQAYLDNLPSDRQHYTCNCCKRFIQRFGGLVAIQDGKTVSAFWKGPCPAFFLESVRAMDALVSGRKVTGVFYSSEAVFGTPQTKEWTHLSCKNPRVHSGALDASQKAAEKLEEYKMVSRALSEVTHDTAIQAVRVLGALDRNEKSMGVAMWVERLKCENIRGAALWAEIASAPAGFAHFRSGMLSTLYDDLKAGLSFETVKARWSEKVHPLQYQRPQALPKAGNIAEAEKLVEKLGLARSFERRFARLDEVTTIWKPVPQEPLHGTSVFAHLYSNPATKPLELPEEKVTWEKFKKLLPDILRIEAFCPHVGSYYGLTTAVHADAPVIHQWGNPFSHYFYNNGSMLSRWGLSFGWNDVAAVFLHPSTWAGGSELNQAFNAYFAISAAHDASISSLALFPETIKSELHGIRSVIEAHSASSKVQGIGNANGIAFSDKSPIRLRVHTKLGAQIYLIDRRD